jgi:MFS family permease
MVPQSELKRSASAHSTAAFNRWLIPVAAVAVHICIGAFGGTWVERRGPRAAAIASAILFVSGLILGGIGLALRQWWLVFAGMGVVGGMATGVATFLTAWSAGYRRPGHHHRTFQPGKGSDEGEETI